MANGDNAAVAAPAPTAAPSYDWSQDPEFKAAPVEQKIAYLSHIDPDFAKASPDDQQRYIQHVYRPESQPTQFERERTTGKVGAMGTLANKAKSLWNSVTDWQPGKSAEQAQSEFEQARSQLSGIPAFNALEAGLNLVSEMARQATRPLPPDLDTLKYRVGTTMSPLVPGLNPEAQERASERGDTGAVLAENAVPVAALAAGVAARPAMRAGGRLAQRIARGAGGFGEVDVPFAPNALNKELEGRIPRNEPPTARREMQEDIGSRQAAAIDRTREAEAGTEKQVRLAEKVRQDELADAEKLREQDAEARQRRGVEQEKIDRPGERIAQGGKGAHNLVSESPNQPGTLADRVRRSSSEGVLHMPESRPVARGEIPKAMWSVPRNELAADAARGKPGAFEVLRDLGHPIVLEPKEGVGWPGPRLIDQMMDTPSGPMGETTLESVPTERGGGPQTAPSLTAKAGIERRGQPRINGGQSLARTSRMNDLRSLAADESAPARDREIASQQLADMKAHPFDTGGETLGAKMRNARAQGGKGGSSEPRGVLSSELSKYYGKPENAKALHDWARDNNMSIRSAARTALANHMGQLEGGPGEGDLGRAAGGGSANPWRNVSDAEVNELLRIVGGEEK